MSQSNSSSGLRYGDTWLTELETMGFPLQIDSSRKPNSYPTAKLEPADEQMLRDLVPDYAEFFIPVNWSRGEFDGIALGSQKFDAVSAIKQFEAETKNLEVTIRPTARNSSGYFKQGFLVVCRQGVALIGIMPLWTPRIKLTSFERDYLKPAEQQAILGDPQRLASVMPPPDVQVERQLVAYFTFTDIESLEEFELVRFDGYVAALNAEETFDNALLQEKRGVRYGHPFFDMQKKAAKKDGEKYSSPKNSVNWRPFRDFPDEMFLGYQIYLDDYALLGVSPVSGPGISSDGSFSKLLFTPALGIVLTHAQNGSKIVIESIFSELDTAVELIETLRKSPSSVAPQPSAPQATASGDISEQMSRLAELFQKGLLTPEEFADAKKKLLGT